jgi:hypothetical protein
MKLCSILPYFIIGPPLYKDVIQTNPSLQFLDVILKNKQKGLPNVSIPMVDVRDVA